MTRQEAIAEVTRRILDCYPALACHEASIRAHVATAYGYGHHHAIVGLTEELARLRGETLTPKPDDEPMREATWQCYQCERRGMILHDKRAGVWEITQKIGKDHQATSPGCPASYRELGILLQIDMNPLASERKNA